MKAKISRHNYNQKIPGLTDINFETFSKPLRKILLRRRFRRGGPIVTKLYYFRVYKTKLVMQTCNIFKFHQKQSSNG